MVDIVLADEDAGRAGHRVGVDSVQLDRAGGLPWVELQHVPGLLVSDDQAPGGDHLADVQAGALLAAELAIGGVGHARHRREHDG